MNKRFSGKLRTWIEVDLKAIKHNYKAFRTIIPKPVMISAVVKSNAYGHDLLKFSKIISKLGADFLMVDSIVEALALRKNSINKPILVLGYTLPLRIREALKHRVSLTISSLDGLQTVIQIAKEHERKIKIHIKVDTGLSRQGFLKQDRKKVINLLLKNKEFVEVEGIYTHFSMAKNPNSSQKVSLQLDKFNEWVKEFKENGFKPIIHSAATGAAFIFPQSHFDMVRVGIGMYGLWPSLETKKYLSRKISLTPVLTWKTIISEVKRLPKGSTVGYDDTKVLSKDSTIAICPIGYWHGYPRSLSNKGFVLVRGRRAKVIGRVSMDMIVIDITGISGVKLGDEVVLIGKQGREEMSAYEIGDLAETSWYEMVTCLNPLIKRIYV